jgi:DNA-directed RNA polymerase specialized sigma24 family protein
MKTNNYAGIHPHIVVVIAHTARKFIGCHGLTDCDIADIEQDLHIKVDRAKLDPQDPFFERNVRKIVKDAMVDLIRFREWKCRDWHLECLSLDQCATDCDGHEGSVGQFLDFEDGWLTAFGLPQTWHGRRDIAADLADAFAGLPDELRSLADVLDACDGNLSEAARSLGLSRKKARIMLMRLQESLAWLRK